ncbi:MAG: hypothetical protein RL588_1568 [Pseudomonadota bacterium]
MTLQAKNLSGVPVLSLSRIPSRGGASDLVGAALEAGARWVALPADGLPEGFLDLSTGVAGEIAQKCVNYGVGLAVLGDLSAAAGRSAPLRDWMRESNRGRHVWFVADEAELAFRLASKGEV